MSFNWQYIEKKLDVMTREELNTLLLKVQQTRRKLLKYKKDADEEISK